MKVFFAIVGNDTSSAQDVVIQRAKRLNNKQFSTYIPSYSSANCLFGFLQKSDQNEPLTKRRDKSFDKLPLVLNSQLHTNTFIKGNSSLPVSTYLNELTVKISDSHGSSASKGSSQQAQSDTKSNASLSDCLANLTGHFRLAHFAEQAQVLCMAISPFNPETLFYAKLPEYNNTYVISTNIKVLLSLVTPAVCSTSLALWLSGRPHPNRSMYSNVHQVPQASYVLISGKGNISTHRFWDISATTTFDYANESELQLKLQSLLENSTKQNIAGEPAATAIFSQLSGGMDSTSVSAIAHRVISNSNKRLHSVSHTYASTESCNEIDNINAMTSQFNFAQSHFIELDKYTQMSFAELYPTHPQSPGMVLSPKYYEEAKLMQQHKASVLLTGNGGDEMFWGHSLAYYDRLIKGDVSVLIEVMKGAKRLDLPVLRTLRSVFISPFVKYDLMPFLHLAERFSALNDNAHIPPWLTPSSKMLIEEAPALLNPFAVKGVELAKYARYEGLFNTSTFNSMRSYQAVFDEFDLQVRHPLFTKEIAEFSFSVSQGVHISNQYPKLLLRQTMDKLLPKQVCWDQHKTVFDQHFAKLVKENAQSLRLLLQHTALQDLGLVDNAKLLAVFDQLISSNKPSLNVDLLYAILVQSWYQAHVES